MMERLFFKDSKNGEVSEYLSEEEFERFGGKDLVRMTADEVHLHLSAPSKSVEDVQRQRLMAYADPIYGSDRYKSEAYAERLAGNEEAAVEAERNLLIRREEIRKENPWPKS